MTLKHHASETVLSMFALDPDRRSNAPAIRLNVSSRRS